MVVLSRDPARSWSGSLRSSQRRRWADVVIQVDSPKFRCEHLEIEEHIQLWSGSRCGHDISDGAATQLTSPDNRNICTVRISAV